MDRNFKEELYEPIIFVDESRRKDEPQPAIIFSQETKREREQQAVRAVGNPIDRVFDNIYSLVGSPTGVPSQAVMMDPQSNACQQTNHLPVQTIQDRFPVVATTQAPDQQSGTPTFRKSRMQIKPVDLERKLKSCLNIRVKGENVYVFTGHFYHKMSA